MQTDKYHDRQVTGRNPQISFRLPVLTLLLQFDLQQFLKAALKTP